MKHKSNCIIFLRRLILYCALVHDIKYKFDEGLQRSWSMNGIVQGNNWCSDALDFFLTIRMVKLRGILKLRCKFQLDKVI
jgi:hypothetical protein